jgi:hypothetical protein
MPVPTTAGRDATASTAATTTKLTTFGAGCF